MKAHLPWVYGSGLYDECVTPRDVSRTKGGNSSSRSDQVLGWQERGPRAASVTDRHASQTPGTP